MSSSNDELPEIQLEEVLDEEKQATPAADDGLAIDIDFGDGPSPPPPPVARGVPPGAALPPAPPPVSDELALDISFDEPAPPAPAVIKPAPAPPAPAVTKPAPAPPAPAVTKPAPAPPSPVAAKPAPGGKATGKPDLDLDALLSDLDLGGELGTAKELTESLDVADEAQEPAPPPARDEAPPVAPADLGELDDAPSPADEPQFSLDGLDASDEPKAGRPAVATLHEVATELERREEEEHAAADARPVADVAAEVSAAFDLAGELEPGEPELPPEAEPAVAEADATDLAPEGELDFTSAAPPLPYSPAEPAPEPLAGLEEIAHSPETLAMLKQLAGAAADPGAARLALHAALKGEPYDPRALPDPRAMVLGLARVLAATGYSVNEMVDAIVAALEE